MNSFGFITLVTLLAVLSCSVYSYNYNSPITLCMKSDFSWCTNVTYPTGCVNMDTVVMNGTGHCYSYPSAFKSVESVIVVDLDNSENKCIVLYDTYNCQGQSLVLNGSKHPSANLDNFGFSNRAESYRPCTDRVLTYLRDN